ncbi:ABC transporter permease [Microbacterium sp. SLBN-111]|uniref:ABC transporter permease n=1 Tax=Microbacterium sp. SLBN-111 TaxID=3377733 RepID=UPI003C74B495
MRSGTRADRFGIGDLLIEGTSDIGARPGRLILTIAGAVLGIAALVATAGLAATASDQIARQFDAVASTQVVARPATAKNAQGADVATASLPDDAAERVGRLVGVEAATTLSPLDLRGGTVSAVTVVDPSAPATLAPKVYASGPGLVDAVGARIVHGRFFDAGHDRRGDRVAVLGPEAATALGVHRIDSQPSIFVDGHAYSVIGILSDADAVGDLAGAVVIPDGAARRDFGLRSPSEVRARIAVGAGPQLRSRLALALSPDAPDTISVGAPASRSAVGASVQNDVASLFAMVGVVVLLVGGLGIATVTTLSVSERTAEIGLRRALGATRRQVAAQFIVESVVIGGLGGLVGASLGVFTVVVVALVQQWTPVLDPWVSVGGAFLGAAIGLVAGGLPARRAARIEPVEALRGA